MTDLRHNEPLVRDMLKAYWANYSIKPDATVIRESIAWGMGLDKDALEHALNIDNHGEFPQNRNPRLVDLKRLANHFRDARGDFYRAPLPDTSLPEGSTCLYCCEGEVYDLTWIESKGWRQVKMGRCKYCSGGDSGPCIEITTIAERTGLYCVRVIFGLLSQLLVLKMRSRDLSKDQLARVIQELYPLPEGAVEIPEETILEATLAKTESGAQAPIKAGVAMEDGFVPDVDGVPF